MAHRTQAELGADLIGEVKVPGTARVIVLGDTAYEAQVVRQASRATSQDSIIGVSAAA